MSKQAKGDRLAWFKFDPAAFMVDVEGLPPAEVGIYSQLLCRYWIGQGMMHEPERLARTLGLSTDGEKETLTRVLTMFFPEGKHGAMDELLCEAAHVSATARENGRKGGRRTGQTSPSQPPASGRGSGPSMHLENHEDEDF